MFALRLDSNRLPWRKGLGLGAWAGAELDFHGDHGGHGVKARNLATEVSVVRSSVLVHAMYLFRTPCSSVSPVEILFFLPFNSLF